MNDTTTELTKLRALAERLAVEVCGVRKYALWSGGPDDYGYEFPDGKKMPYANRKWRPWENLDQAWMVLEKLRQGYNKPRGEYLVGVCVDEDGYDITLYRKCECGSDKTCFDGWYVKTLDELPRAIFDAACLAMGYNDNKT